MSKSGQSGPRSMEEIDKDPHLIFSQYPYNEKTQLQETPFRRYNYKLDLHESVRYYKTSNLEPEKFVHLMMLYYEKRKVHEADLYELAQYGCESYLKDNPNMKDEFKFYIIFYRIYSLVIFMKKNPYRPTHSTIESLFKKGKESLKTSLKQGQITQEEMEHYSIIFKLLYATYLDVAGKSPEEALYYFRKVIMFCFTKPSISEEIYNKAVYNLAFFFNKMKMIDEAAACYDSLFYIATCSTRKSIYLNRKTKNMGRLAVNCTTWLMNAGKYEKAREIVSKTLREGLYSRDDERELIRLKQKI
ncbi:hypothetical protein C9374_007153 [Naegleria lovaniensis]|uniref:Uncharacterized protein n=1 Tax=Naegleria lovaniensis TaxID=51637 RepID=A0AA88KRX0_NAELO|nr:uncharacterized protein C9374_007153 [Naegleria lovaniensis]KAG2393622.1 hypothetical protein C9374_007153 [Naegleria lovaniensis]